MIRCIAALALLALLVPAPAPAQTCSCAAVPILGAMRAATPGGDQWLLVGTYEYHDISELVQGSDTVPDASGRERLSQAFIVETSRGFGSKWTVSGLLSMVEHERTVAATSVSARGVGDAVLMARFSPRSISLYDRTTVSLGLGARLPVGVSDAKAGGVVLAEDMQPSTGAYGGIAWLHIARALNESASTRLYAGGSYTHNGENDRDYRFGHATRINFGASHRTQSAWGFNLEFVYRHAPRDERNGVPIPNTGGQWFDAVPALQYHLNETVAIEAAATIPLARDLNDQLQFTTRYAARLSVAGVFGSR